MTPPLANAGDLIELAEGDEPLALIDLSRPGGLPVSRRQLNQLADAYARLVAAVGPPRGGRVAVVAANRSEHLAAVFGIQRAGCVAVPLNTKLPPPQLASLLAASGATLVFCDAARRAALPPELRTIDFDAPGTPRVETLPADAPPPFATVAPQPGEAALILYTSGSSGRPKGVVLSHGSQLWTVHKRAAGGALRGERLLVAAPLYHMNALALAQLACVARATVVLMPGFEVHAYIEAIARHRCTGLTSVPPMMAMLLREAAALDAADLRSVRWIRMGSAPVSATLLQGLRRRFPQAALHIAYGTTEGGPVVFAPHPQGLPKPPLALGVADPEVPVRLVDAQGQEADEGVLHLRSPALMNHYHEAPELTARAFSADGYYITGDILARDAQGFYTFVGRADDMFVCGGENIYPAEVQRVIETHAAVEQAAVVALPDEIKGAKPVAFVVLRPGASADEDQLRRHVLALAPPYMHPRRVWFLPALPLAATHKVDRQRLLVQAQALLDRAAG